MSIMHHIQSYISLFPREEKALKPLITHIQENSNQLFERTTLPGHITGSGFVIQDQQLLCIYHPFLQRWFQPGGHVEQGESSLQGAMREVTEETGFPVILHPWHNSKEVPFDIDIHYIPANQQKNMPGHYHYDFRYLFQVDSSKASLPNELDYAWVPFHQLDDDLMRAVGKLNTLK